MEQRSPEWFAARIGKVTGSNVGAILGLDPNRDRKDVMRAMVRDAHGADKEWSGNIATQWGQTHEDEAKEDFEGDTGLSVEKASFVIHPSMQWLGASPDGYVGDDAVLEVKCPFGKRKATSPAEFKSLEEQPHYLAQMQIEMLVTGRSRCFFWQWAPGAFKLEVVHADPEYQAKIVAELEVFYQDYLRECADPGDHLADERVIVDTPRALQLVAEYSDLNDAIAKAEERKEELLEAMVEMAKGRNAIFGGKKLTLTHRAGSISYAQAVKVLAPGADLERWRGKPSSSWGLK